MGSTNSLPVVSQAKSGFQLICGDVDGAAETQKDFLQGCPVVSQLTSGVQLLAGDPEGALETQKKCVKGLSNFADGIPAVGHVKGVIHYACGDAEGGNKAMKSATRTTAVMGAGAGGFIVGGPVGAVGAGIAGGAAYDTAVTAVDSAVHSEFRPSGYYAAVDNVINNPNAGGVFDAVMVPVGDGLAGYSGGRIANQLKNAGGGGTGGSKAPPSQANLAKANLLDAEANALLDKMNDVQAGKIDMTSGDLYNIGEQAKSLWNEANDLRGTNRPPPNFKIPEPTTNAPGGISTSTSASSETRQETNQQERPSTSSSHVSKEVWVIWLDEVPIIGTDSATVEFVQATLFRDKVTMQKILSQMGLTEPEIISKFIEAAFEFVEKSLDSQALKGFSKEKLQELLKKTGKKGKAAVKAFIASIFHQSKNETEKKKKRSKRGEHIINNDVLNVHKTIVEIFLARVNITRDGIGGLTPRLNATDSHLMRDCTRYFSQQIRTDIQDVLKVHFDKDEIYIDANAVLYGSLIGLLREEAVAHMTELYWNWQANSTQGSRYSQPLKATVEGIIGSLAFVDNAALEKWRRMGNPERKYVLAKDAVCEMFEGLYERIWDWVAELKRAGYNN